MKNIKNANIQNQIIGFIFHYQHDMGYNNGIPLKMILENMKPKDNEEKQQIILEMQALLKDGKILNESVYSVNEKPSEANLKAFV